MTRRSERGAASVETAIVLAFVLVPLLMGLADLSRVLFTRIALQEAVQQGAYFYSFEETTSAGQVVNQVINSTDSLSLAASDVTTGCTDVARSTGGGAVVTVTATTDVDLIFPLVASPITLERTAEAERFYPCP